MKVGTYKGHVISVFLRDEHCPPHVHVRGKQWDARFRFSFLDGFEPLDVMQAILMLVRQVNEGRAEVENEFIRAVGRYGNTGAQALMDEVFELRPSFEWRGLGEVPLSALRIRPAFARYDAEVRFDLEYQAVPDHKACECGAILRGQKKPTDCRLFGTVCTPENPMGSCMVSNEGACAAHYAYGRYKDIEVVAL